MASPPSSRTVLLAASLWLSLQATAPVAAQPASPEEFGVSLVASALGSGLFVLVVGGGFVALAPDYAKRTTDRVRSDPVTAFIYGLGITIAAVIVGVILVITIIGIFVVIPMFIALAIVGYLGYLAAGRSVSDDWGVALLVAIVLGVLTGAVPILGGILGFVLSSMGVGAAYLDYRDDDASGGQASGRDGRSRTGGRPGLERQRREDARQADTGWGHDQDDDPGSPR